MALSINWRPDIGLTPPRMPYRGQVGRSVPSSFNSTSHRPAISDVNYLWGTRVAAIMAAASDWPVNRHAPTRPMEPTMS